METDLFGLEQVHARQHNILLSVQQPEKQEQWMELFPGLDVTSLRMHQGHHQYERLTLNLPEHHPTRFLQSNGEKLV